MIGDIIERPSEAPMPPTMPSPTASRGGFPAARHRSVRTFGRKLAVGGAAGFASTSATSADFAMPQASRSPAASEALLRSYSKYYFPPRAQAASAAAGPATVAESDASDVDAHNRPAHIASTLRLAGPLRLSVLR